jgi:hypothetical protein
LFRTRFVEQRRERGSGVRRAFHVTLLIVLACMTTEVAHAASSWKLHQQARTAADAGEHDRAHKLYTKARRRTPDSEFLAFDHAQVLAAAGRADEALVALGSAVALGYRLEHKLLRSESLASLQGAPQWDDLLERTRSNQTEFQTRLDLARQPVAPEDARAFDGLEALLEAKDLDERELYEPRLADAKRGDPEREQALAELVRLRVGEAQGLDLRWQRDATEKVAAATERYLADHAAAANATEVRVAQVVARTVAPFPEDVFSLPQSSWPQPRCDETLPELEAMSSGDATDPWTRVAGGFKALCLAETDSDRHDEIRAGADAYLQAEPTDNGYDLTLRAGLKIALWRLDGLPEFEAEALAGGTLSVADFKGKVTLLDFWNPG